MPQPTLLLLALGSGVAAAIASRRELRISPRHALLSRGFFAYMAFATLVLVPISVYFYVFHGDWSLLYLFDVRRIPSAVALIGFVLEALVGAAGYLLGAALVRSQRDTIGGAVVGASVLAALSVVVLARDRLGVVGSYAQFRGGFGLEPYSGGAVFRGTLLMSGLLVAGIAYLLVRLHFGGRRGG